MFKELKEEHEKDVALCCCEFIDNNDEKSHLLAVCCNCEDFDLVVTRCVTCSKLDNYTGNIEKMLLTFQTRLRIPWRGGAKQISYSVLMPAVQLPFMFAFAALSAPLTLIVFILNFAFIIYVYYRARKRKTRSNYFPALLFWSAVHLMLLFNLTVPLLEVLPEENLLLVLLTASALFCLYRTQKRAALNQVVLLEQRGATNGAGANENANGVGDEEEVSLLIEPDLAQLTNESKESHNQSDAGIHHASHANVGNQCKRCSKEALTLHCDVCSLCVLQRSHHSYWLNCCIGKLNLRYYLFGLVLSELALLFFANLTLTAICHPVLVLRLLGISIMLPDDCTEVYDEYKFGIAFVIAAYALILAFCVLLECVKQTFALLTNYWQKNERNAMRQRKSIWTDSRSFASYAN